MDISTRGSDAILAYAGGDENSDTATCKIKQIFFSSAHHERRFCFGI